MIGAVGSQLGWGDLRLPSWLIYPLPFLVLASALFAERPNRRLHVLTLSASVLALLCYSSVFLLLYLQFNAVGAPTIEGVQGRYFMPAAILLLCVAPRIKTSEARMSKIWVGAATVAAASSAVTLVATYLRYW